MEKLVRKQETDSTALLRRASRKKKEVLSGENFSSFCLFVPKGRVEETMVKCFASTVLGRNPSYPSSGKDGTILLVAANVMTEMRIISRYECI